MKKSILIVIASILVFGVLSINTQAAMVSEQPNIWSEIAERIKQIFYPQQYSAFTYDVYNNSQPSTFNPFSQYQNTQLNNSNTASSDTSGYNCNQTNYTCVKVSSNAKYQGVNALNDCNKACKAPSSSSSNTQTNTNTNTYTNTYGNQYQNQTGSTTQQTQTGSTTPQTQTNWQTQNQSQTQTGSGNWQTSGGYTTTPGTGATNQWSTSGGYTTTPSTGANQWSTSGGYNTTTPGAANQWSTSGGYTTTPGASTNQWSTSGGYTTTPGASTNQWSTSGGYTTTPGASTNQWSTSGGYTTTPGASTNQWSTTGGTGNQFQTTPGTGTGNLWTGFFNSIKDLLGIPTTNNTQGDNKTTVPTISPLDLNKPSLYTTEGSSSDTGDECKITSIYLDSKQPIYEIGDTIKGTIRSSCADKLKISKYTIQFLPEHGDKGITISSTDGKFEQRYDINIITILAKAGQSGKTKVKIVAVGNYENAKGEAKITVPKEIYITVDAGSTEGDTTPTGGKTIKIAVDKKEYNKLNDTIKLTIVSKPEGLVDCGYNLEADYQNTGKYGYKVEGIEIPNCTGSINIPVNKAYKMKLSVAGYIRKGNKTTTYESDPQFIELVYKPGAKTDTSKIKNDCYLDIVSMTPNTNKIYVTNQQTQDITVKFKLVCTDYSTIDVKPTKVSAYIDIHDLYNEGKKQSVLCQSQNMNAEVYKSGTEYTLSCSAKTLATLPNDARLKLLMVDMYYLTNQEDGFHHGEEHTERFISTRDKAIQIVTNENKGGDKGGGAEGKPSPEQQKEIIHLSVNPTIAYENQELTFTITSDYKPQANEAKCMIYWKNSDQKEGNFISNYSLDNLLTTKIFKAKKDGAQQTYIQVRCADATIATKYYSNTVTVHLAESWGEICKANPCQFTFDITKQINLKYENNKPISSDNLTMKVVGKGNLNKFQKTFARIKIDNTIIQDITIPDSGIREYAISNLWSKLPAQTKTNIENTLKTYNSAKVNATLEVWSTFDEEQAKTNKKVNCNWLLTTQDIVFTKQTTKPPETKPTDTKPEESKEGAWVKLKADKTKIKKGESVIFSWESGGGVHDACTLDCYDGAGELIIAWAGLGKTDKKEIIPEENCVCRVHCISEELNELIDNIDDKGGEEKFREYVKDDKNRGIVFSNNVKIEVLSSKEPEKSTIQGQIPTGCSKVSISDDITNKSIPSASVQLVNKDNKYSGLAKVNAYIDVPGYSTIFLPDWNSNGAKGITNLVYPFNLNTSSALKELAKIPSSKINQATLTINVWAFTKDGGFMDLCNRHKFTNKGGEITPSTKPPEPKKATNCSTICNQAPSITFGLMGLGAQSSFVSWENLPKDLTYNNILMSRLCVRVNYKNCNNQAIFNRGIALKVNNSLIKTQTFTPDNYTMYYLASQTGAIDICSGTVKELEQLGELKFVPDKLHFATLKLSADTTLCTDKNCLLYCFYENSVQKKVNLTSIEQQR